MKKIDLIRGLSALDRHGVYVLSKGDIEKMFPDEQEKALEKSLQRMVADGLLVRVAKGFYLNPAALSKNSRVVEQIAQTMRPGHFNYLSLESILSEYGVISQIPPSRITVMTTGASGTYQTPYGTIEFTRTKRRPPAIIQRTISVEGRPLRIARKDAAIKDLMRVGRNTNMIMQSEL